MEDRDLDKKTFIVPTKESRKAKTRAASLDVIKSAYIAEGLSEEELCERFALTPEKAAEIVTDNKLSALRKAHIKKGLNTLQEQQTSQAHQLLEIEKKFQQLKIVQLEERLKNYLAYYDRHGTLNKKHPITGEFLTDAHGIPMELPIPDLMREIKAIKESISLSEGLKTLMISLKDVIDPKGKSKKTSGNIDEYLFDDDEIIDMENIEGWFEQKAREEVTEEDE